METLELLTVNATGVLREATYDGEDYWVVDATMIVEGVLPGSEGAGFYSKEENERSMAAWNMKPFVLDHPVGPGGKPVSAADPNILEKINLGFLLNTKHGGSNLGAEVWANKRLVKAKNAEWFIEKLKANKKVEISTGLFLDRELGKGTFNGQNYEWKAKNYRPDHLALITKGKGACSVDAGCGLSINCSCEKAPADNAATVTTGMTQRQIHHELHSQLAAKHGEPGKSWYGGVEEVYPKHVVYSTPDGETMLHEYAPSKDGAPKLTGSPVKVRRVTGYRTEDGRMVGNEEGQMAQTKFDKKAHLDGLVGNGYEESDRKWLEALPDENLQKIKAVPKEAPAPTTNTTPVTPPPAKPPEPVTFEQLLANASPEVREVVQEGVAARTREITELTARITGYAQNQFTPEELGKMPLPLLRKQAAMVPGPAVNMAGAGGLLPGLGGKPQEPLKGPSRTFAAPASKN